jgi:hypothetical protein
MKPTTEGYSHSRHNAINRAANPFAIKSAGRRQSVTLLAIVAPEIAVAVATGNNAKVYRNGDIMGVGAVITAGVPRFVGRSRNTPETTRRAKVAHSRIPQNFSGEA